MTVTDCPADPDGEDVLIRRCDYHPQSDSSQRLQLFQYMAHQALAGRKIVLIYIVASLLDKNQVYTVRKHSIGFSYRKAAMLAQLTISNFAIVQNWEIDFHSGRPPSPGKPAPETIAVDALGLCLGGRAEADMVRVAAPPVLDLCARCTLKIPPAAQRWLEREPAEKAGVGVSAG